MLLLQTKGMLHSVSPPPAKRQKLLSDSYQYPDPDPIDIPFSIRWGEHPETSNIPVERAVEPINAEKPYVFHPQPVYQPSFSLPDKELEKYHDFELSTAEKMFGPLPNPFPDLSIDKVMEILNYCNHGNNVCQTSHQPKPANFIQHSDNSLKLDGPLHSDWFISGFTSDVSFQAIEEVVQAFLYRSRYDSDINTRLTLVLEDRHRSVVGDCFKTRLWDVTPTKLAQEIYSQLSKHQKYIYMAKVHAKITVSHQENTVKVLSDDDVKKKRSIITIYEKPEASLIHAVYVGVQRNRIISEKKATANSKKKKELENRLTNEYRKGRKSLRKKTQMLLDYNKVSKSIDDVWNFKDIPMLEIQLGVRCVVFSAQGKCLYEGNYQYQDNEIDLLYICDRFHVLASRNVFRNYCPHSATK